MISQNTTSSITRHTSRAEGTEGIIRSYHSKLDVLKTIQDNYVFTKMLSFDVR